MSNDLMRSLRSLLKLSWLMVREMALIGCALLRCDVRAAGGRARILAVSVHNDLLLLVAACQRLLPLWRLPKPEIDRILIVKLDRIGDMVTTTPVFDVLHQLFPKAKLDIVGHPVPLSLLEGDDRIGELIAYRSWLYHPLPIQPPGLKSWLIVLKLLWRRYPLVVYLRGSFPLLLLGITSRIAATKFVVAEPVITRYLKALESLFGPLPRPAPRLQLQADAARIAQALLSEGPSGPRIVIHAAASAATKVWPAERFAALADQLVEVCQARVHFLGSRDEKTSLDRIAQLATHAHAFHCALRLPQVSAVIAASDLFIGNDSGLAHIAAAVGTRMVVLWGPANLSMARPETAPQSCAILYHDLPCRQVCPEFQCVNPAPLDCLMRIQTADVVEAAQRLLQPSHANGRRKGLPLLASSGLI